jgi:hypothetical protein
VLDLGRSLVAVELLHHADTTALGVVTRQVQPALEGDGLQVGVEGEGRIGAVYY